MDLDVKIPLSDFELVEKYKAILHTLHRVSDDLEEKHPYEDLEVTILGYACTLTAHEVSGVIAAQIRMFKRLLTQTQDRIHRSEGKVA
jgi:hypothetical protein